MNHLRPSPHKPNEEEEESPLDTYAAEALQLGTAYLTGHHNPTMTKQQDWAESTSTDMSHNNHHDPTPSSGSSPMSPFIGDDLLQQEEKDFMAYVMSFPSSAEVSKELLKKSQPDVTNAKVGLDHLDNLCKLMEQLSDLKETNIKLRRRVQYLEDIKTLHEIHKEMVGERKLYNSGLSEDEVQQLKEKLGVPREPSEESYDSNLHLEPPPEEPLIGLYRSKTAEQIGEYKTTRKDKLGVPSQERVPSEQAANQEQLYGLYRSKTANQIGEYNNTTTKACERGHKSRSTTASKERRERSKSVGHPGHSKNKKRASRWSKVKEVLGIERSEAEGSDAPQGDPSKAYKLSCSKSHSNVLSSRSFSEAERQNCSTPVQLAKKSGTLDSKTAQAAMESFEKEMAIKKSPKTPWGKMKTMIQIRRDNRHPKSESSSSSPRDAKPAKSTETANGHSPRRTQRNRSSHGDTGPPGESPRLDRQRLEAGRQKSPCSRKSSAAHSESGGAKTDPDPTQRTRQDELDAYLGLREPIIPKEVKQRKKSKSRPPPLDYHHPSSEAATMDDHPGMSPSAHKKWMWSRVKDVLKGGGGGKGREGEGHFSLSAPSSPASDAAAMAFDFDVVVEKGESFPAPSGQQRGSEGVLHTASTVAELMLELQQNLSDDFNKKLEEWQRCQVERKDSFGARVRKVSKPDKKAAAAAAVEKKSPHHLPKKDLSWLEKEEQKVDREILRLSKEKQKFEKRSFHLKQLRASLTEQKREVFVRTSAGEFRFEGISDAFTKKLVEWEAKKGVVSPELSTIALLDESAKTPAEQQVPVGSNSTRTSPEPPKSCYQVSRASSEPDLSTSVKDAGASNQGTMRSKSGDTLLTGEMEVASLDTETVCKLEPETRHPIHHSEDNYYSLLEENMYLIDQLKDKEDICSYLQNELERLDDKTEKANRIHQEEMEKYRQKLWEIHMSRPRDLQGSLHLISELKSRIEELQKCSDELKSDREKLEESFRYHSNQQTRLADDLIRKVREMQISNTSFSGFSRGGSRRKWRKYVKCDPISITRMHDLSTQLLQQVRDMEQMVLERTRQVCHLRWELLHRDMSAVLLQAALHRVTSQGEPPAILPTWDKRRSRFKNIKAWSVDTTTRRPSEDLVTDDWLQERLRQLAMTPYNDWTNIDFSPNDLMTTAHELKKEALRLSISKPDRGSDTEEKKSGVYSAESEMADSDRCYCDTGSAVNSRSSSFSSGGGGRLRGSHSDTRLYERTRMRRASSSSMSCVEVASDSSSMHDSEVRRFPWRPQWRSMENLSSSCSSRSSILDEDMLRCQRRPTRGNRAVESLEDVRRRYGAFRETDEEGEERGSQCLITPRPIHLPRVESSSPESSRGHARRGYSYSRTAKPSYGELRDFRLPSSSIDVTDTGLQSALSAESLDKYETAIRDEELTIGDEFKPQEEELKRHQQQQRTHHSKSVTSPHCMAGYIDRRVVRGSPTPGSPNIAKFKYKGTKGFGRTRVGYGRGEDGKGGFGKGFKGSEIQHVDI